MSGLVVGLGGPIGAGKSLAARVAAEEGWTVVDADRLVHRLYEPGQKLAGEIFAAFPSVRAADGSVDRRALGRIVFGDAAALARLNALVRPAVGGAIISRCRRAHEEGTFLVLEIPLLSKSEAYYRECDAIVVVVADDMVRLARVMERDRLPEEEAAARLARAVPQEELRSCATYVLENSADEAGFRRRAAELWRRLHG